MLKCLILMNRSIQHRMTEMYSSQDCWILFIVIQEGIEGRSGSGSTDYFWGDSSEFCPQCHHTSGRVSPQIFRRFQFLGEINSVDDIDQPQSQHPFLLPPGMTNRFSVFLKGGVISNKSLGQNRHPTFEKLMTGMKWCNTFRTMIWESPQYHSVWVKTAVRWFVA